MHFLCSEKDSKVRICRVQVCNWQIEARHNFHQKLDFLRLVTDTDVARFVTINCIITTLGLLCLLLLSESFQTLGRTLSHDILEGLDLTMAVECFVLGSEFDFADFSRTAAAKGRLHFVALDRQVSNLFQFPLTVFDIAFVL